MALTVTFTGKKENRGGQSGVGSPKKPAGIPTNTGGKARYPQAK